jgi:HAMP domain-containing protein
VITTTETLVAAMRALANDIQSEDGVANAAIAEAAQRLEEQQDRIKRLEAVTNDPHALWANWLRGSVALPAGIGDVRQYQDRIKRLEESLKSIREYWNRDNNNRALIDACWYAIDTASEALEAKEAKP